MPKCLRRWELHILCQFHRSTFNMVLALRAFPRVGFIVANPETDSRAVVRFCNQRGTAEHWIKASQQAVKMTGLSCHRFRSNEVRLPLSLIAYNVGNLWRGLVKTGGRLIKHARYDWLLLGDGSSDAAAFRGDGAAGKQTGRRKEGDGEVYKKSLGMRHFRVFRARGRQSQPAPSAVRVARDGKDEQKRCKGGGWTCNRCWPGWQNGNPG